MTIKTVRHIACISFKDRQAMDKQKKNKERLGKVRYEKTDTAQNRDTRALFHKAGSTN